MLCGFALFFASSAVGSTSAPAVPSGLHAFQYRAGDPVAAGHSYTQMPAFAWQPVAGASKYELELATSVTFADSTVLLDDDKVLTPVTSVQKQVPWMTGHPYAFWVRVRAIRGEKVSGWSAPFGFNTSWDEVPQQLPAPNGLVRWSPVAGATGYEVWFQDIGVRARTLTNVADEREYWTLHPAAAKTVRWRVRALRYVKDSALPNKIPVITYGPYTQTFVSSNDVALSGSTLDGTDAISDVDSTAKTVRPNELMPGFAWRGTTGAGGVQGSGLWRVYVFSDRQCVNMVTVGSIVGGPAWAPRWAPPLQLPTTGKALTDFANFALKLTYGKQDGSQMLDGTKIVTAEEAVDTGSSSGSASGGSSSGSGSSGSSGGSSSGNDPSFTTNPGSVALPDNGWPAGRYWWTVVPVAAYVDSKTDAATYADMELPQDVCASGRVWPFGMESMAVTTDRSAPYASGIRGARVVSAASARPTFSQLPVVTWDPAVGAQSYEIQLSRKLYPWRAAISQVSVVPSVTLNLKPTDVGVWYYRVRGVNANLPGSAIKMTWSKPAAIRISGNEFRVVK